MLTQTCYHNDIILLYYYYIIIIIIIIIILHMSKINHFQTTSHITFPSHEMKSKANNKSGIVMQNNTRRCLQVGSQCCLTWNNVRSVTLRLMKRFKTYSKHGNHCVHLFTSDTFMLNATEYRISCHYVLLKKKKRLNYSQTASLKKKGMLQTNTKHAHSTVTTDYLTCRTASMNEAE
jgi:hypothetical protein